MNDKEFREKCRKISNANVDHFIYENDLHRHDLLICHEADADLLKTSALLYIAANMPNPNERAKKSCTFCSDDAKHDTTISHYLYIDSKHKQLVDVCDGTVTRAVIKYCPMCGRKL